MLPSISDYKIKNIRRIVAMQDSTKHLQFLTKVTGILADTFGDIHRMLQEEVKHNTIPHLQHALPLFERPHEPRPLSISLSENNGDFLNDEDEDPENRSLSVKPRKSLHKDPADKQKKIEKKKKTAKWQAEGKPRPPLNAFMLFLKASKSQIMQARPELTPAEVSTYASSLWSELPNEQKDKYRNQYRENREKYLQMMTQYNKTIEKAEGVIIRNKRHHKIPLKTSKTEGGQEVVNIESDEDNSHEI